MDVLTVTDTRANLKEVMGRVVNDHAPVVVTRQKAEAVVMVSLADWNALEETSRLLSSPLNARRHYLYWFEADPNVHARLKDLFNGCQRSPFRGLGKPEPLRGDIQGWLSRRINTEDRLVYRFSGRPPNQALEIAQCRFHY